MWTDIGLCLHVGNPPTFKIISNHHCSPMKQNSDRWGQSFVDCPWGLRGRSWRRFSNAQAWISSMFNEFWGPEGAQGGLWSQAGAWRPNSLTPKPLSGSTPVWIAKLLAVGCCIISRWALGAFVQSLGFFVNCQLQTVSKMRPAGFGKLHILC